jgi:translation elongation factor EF-Tu-like GTPase
MPTADFRFVVDGVFRITGRGTVVTGHFDSGALISGDPACLYMDGAVLHVEAVVMDSLGGLLLKGVQKDEVPRGALLKPCDH